MGSAESIRMEKIAYESRNASSRDILDGTGDNTRRLLQPASSADCQSTRPTRPVTFARTSARDLPHMRCKTRSQSASINKHGRLKRKRRQSRAHGLIIVVIEEATRRA